jgi:hypothetical protein
MAKKTETPVEREARLAKRREHDRAHRQAERDARRADDLFRWLHIENGVPTDDGSVWSEEDQEWY